ncbi:DedA family protein [Candidatus Woesearchaeota archaeon]|jgi:membrane protein YqaA with SNARE-associated domain|nr:DedA family protein [Candidatus Woesearchaeota archaeon]
MNWTLEIFAPLGYWGLFILAFIESSFFPIPPDVLLIVLCVASPELALLYAFICTIGSALGGAFGYFIGFVGEKTVLEKFFSKKKIEKVHKLFDKHGVWAVGIAGFSPIPYKIFTISAGLFYINFWKFFIVSFFSRGARFFIVAILIMLYGQVIVQFLEKYFNIITLGIVLIAVAIFFGYKYLKKKQQVPSHKKVKLKK